MATLTAQLLNTTFSLPSGAEAGQSAIIALPWSRQPGLVFPNDRLVVTVAQATSGAVPLMVELRAVWTDALDQRQVTPLAAEVAGSGAALCVAAGPIVGSAIEIALWSPHALPSAQAVSGVLAVWGV